MNSTGTLRDRPQKTVAIIDHDQAVRDSFSVLLGGVGYAVHTFESGGSLISSLPDLRAQCLLLEFHLPEFNGQAVFERLSELGHKLPTIFMASHPRALPDLASLGSGAIDILHKPIDENCLFPAIERAISLFEAGGPIC